MKKSIFLGLSMFWAGISLFVGCSQEDLDTYDTSRNSIYFGMRNPSSATKNEFVDTTMFSFGDYENITDTTVMIWVNVLGGMVSEPREFEYEIVDSLTTAIEGVHFTIDGKGKGVIPGKAVGCYIPIHIIYSDGMKDRAAWYVVLQLKANANFNLDLKKEYVDKNNGTYIELTRHWVGMSARIQKPQRWYRVQQYFLDFSEDKYKLINQLCHLTKDSWDNMQFYIAEAYWVAVRNYLQERIDAGDPVMEKDERTGRMQPMKVKGLTGI